MITPRQWMILLLLAAGMNGLFAQTVEKLELINASTNLAIRDMPESGDTIDLDATPLISFRAVTNPEPVTGQCIFNLTYPSGATYSHSEGTPVYACFGDMSGDYYDWGSGLGSPPALETGEYSLTVTPGAGTAKTYTFVVVKSGVTPGPEPGDGVEFDTLRVADAEVLFTGEMKQWHDVVFNLGGPAVKESDDPNPFSDYLMMVRFSQGDTVMEIPGYFAADGNARHTRADSGNVWRAHFRPPFTGTWTYAVSFRSGTDVAVSDQDLPGAVLVPYDGLSGSIEVGETDKDGKDLRARGRLQYVGEHHLRFAGDSTWFLKAGADSPENFLAYEGFDNTPNNGGRLKSWAPHESDWRTGDPLWADSQGKGIIGAVNYLASKGMNVFSFLTMAAPQGDDKNVFMWTSTSDFDRFDCSKLDQWEVVFSHAETVGMYLHFKTSETENEVMLNNGNLGRERKLYYRELIARYGHHLALNWNLGEENGNYGDLNQNDQQRKDMAAYFRENDPYQNLIVLHTAPNDYENIYRPLIGDLSELTGISIQTSWQNVHSETAKWVAESAAAGKKWVVANDEQGPHTIGVPEDSYTGSPSKDDIRARVLWGNFMAGGAGVEYYFGYERPESDLSCQDWRARSMSWDYAKIALDFFNQYLPYWAMESRDDLASAGYCYALEGEVYALYLENGGSATLDLADGTYDVMWYNPRTGGAMSQGPEVEGGTDVSIGAAPSSGDDWVALVRSEDFSHEGNGSELYPCGDTIVLTSYNDFPDFALEGFAPAYKDDGNQVLAINAVNYKDVYAAAATSYNGYAGIYNVTITTLTETDGESTYRLVVDGKEIGSFTNPETEVDYAPVTHTWEHVEIKEGDQIRVEFNSHTNGKIPEGTSTAYSRGRWKQLALTPMCNQACTDGDAFTEKDGYVVIEMENTELNSYWSIQEGYSSLGQGFIQYDGANHMSAPVDATTLTYKVQINNPGTYQFKWRTRRGIGAPAFDQYNDSWLRIGASDFYGMKDGSKIECKDHFIKVWIQTDEFSWNCAGEHGVNGFQIFADFDEPGEYLIEVSGRSQYHIIDRMALYMTSMQSVALDLDTPESSKGCGGFVPPLPPFVALEDMYLAYDTIEMIAGETYQMRHTLMPGDASNQEMTWRSLARGVVEVDEKGLFTAKGEGNTRVQATMVEDKVMDYCIVIVHADREKVYLDKSGWTATYADSEDSEKGGGVKEKAIDGDLETFWHTQWFSAQPPLPHELHIDLGQEEDIDILEYWPRQDIWGPDGAIRDFELYVSMDGVDWGEAVHKDHFRWAKNPTKEDYKDMRRVFLDSTAHGRYVKFVAQSEDQMLPEKPFTAVAELDFLAWVVDETGLGLAALEGVEVYPNPFAEVLHLSGMEGVERVSLLRGDGALVLEVPVYGTSEYQLETASLVPGFYMLRFELSGGELGYRKVLKQ